MAEIQYEVKENKGEVLLAYARKFAEKQAEEKAKESSEQK